MTRPATAAPLPAVLAVVLVTLGAYVGGYLWLGETIDENYHRERTYRNAIQARLFAPGARIETWLTGEWIIVSDGERAYP